jgi:hypothetical protein
MELLLILGLGLLALNYLYTDTEENLQKQEIPVEKDDNERRK